MQETLKTRQKAAKHKAVAKNQDTRLVFKSYLSLGKSHKILFFIRFCSPSFFLLCSSFFPLDLILVARKKWINIFFGWKIHTRKNTTCNKTYGSMLHSQFSTSFSAFARKIVGISWISVSMVSCGFFGKWWKFYHTLNTFL